MTFAPATARAEDDEDSIWNLDKRMMNELLYSFGLTKKPKLDDQIDYHERPRLTVPSGQELPAPKPVDPAVARRQEKPKPKRNVQEFDPDEFTNPITPRELRASSGTGAPNRAGVSPTNPARPSQLEGSIDEPLDPMPPSRLGSSGGFFGLFSGGNSSAGNASAANEQREQSGAEPPRRSLIDPPPGYQVRSPSQPYGDGTTARAGNTRPKVDHAVGSDQGL